MLEERGIEEVEPSDDSAGDDTLEPDEEIEAPTSQDDADAAQESTEPPGDPSVESSINSEEVTAAEASAPPVEDSADEPDPPADPLGEAPAPTGTNSPSPELAD